MKTTIYILFLCLLASPTFGGMKRYMRTGGSADSSGATWSAAYASVVTLNDSMNAGDTAFFGPGRFAGMRIIPPGNSGNDTTFYVCSTWASGGDPDGSETWNTAIITGAEVITGWGNVAGNIYAADWDGLPWPATGPDTVACVTWGASDSLLKPDTTRSLSEGNSFYTATGDSLFVWLHGGGDPSGQTIYATRHATVDMMYTGTDHDRMYFAGLDLRIGCEGVVKISYHDFYSTFFHCNLSRMSWTVASGNGGIFWSVNSSSTWGGYHNFIGCDFGHANDIRDDNRNGSGVSIYGQHHVVFDSCTFHHTQASAIYMKESYPISGPGTRDTGSVVRFCTFESTVGEYGIEWYRKNYKDSVYGCIFDGINATSANGNAVIAFNRGSTSDVEGECFIGNNTFYNCINPIKAINEDQLGGNKIMYNVFFDITNTINFMEYENTSMASFSQDSNYWYDASVAFRVDSAVGATYFTWAQWQALGQDVNSFNSDPGLTDPANGDFSRSASGEMNLSYGSRTEPWTVFGAVQPTTVSSHLKSAHVKGVKP